MENNNNNKIALLSVYHKEGIVDFAKQLKELNWKIVASGGTAKTLIDAGISVIDVSSLVGGKAILGHRVVTLSREIHAGLLSRDISEDVEEMKQLGIPRIDLVCVDFYPLQEEIEKSDSTQEKVIEKTDIGGPTMLRSAAKGRRIVVCDFNDRQKVIDWLKNDQPDKEKFITQLVAKAEFITASYCLASAKYHGNSFYDGILGEKKLVCKYGENAPQTPAGLYSSNSNDPLALNKFEVIAGASPSYNNLCDIDRLLQTTTHIATAFNLNYSKTPLIAIAVKHGDRKSVV